MAVAKIQTPEIVLRRLPAHQEDKKERVRLGPQRFPARFQKKTHSIVDETFAALSIRKHAQIEQLIEQTKYGE
jgi:hypothetical protein